MGLRLAALALVISLLPLAQTPAQEPRVIELSLSGGAVEGAALEAAPGGPVLRLDRGEVVELRWRSDSPVELHLHGYEILATTAPGQETVMAFEARAAGRFPLASHGPPGQGLGQEQGQGHNETPGHHHETLLYLEVRP